MTLTREQVIDDLDRVKVGEDNEDSPEYKRLLAHDAAQREQIRRLESDLREMTESRNNQIKLGNNLQDLLAQATARAERAEDLWKSAQLEVEKWARGYRALEELCHQHSQSNSTLTAERDALKGALEKSHEISACGTQCEFCDGVYHIAQHALGGEGRP